MIDSGQNSQAIVAGLKETVYRLGQAQKDLESVIRLGNNENPEFAPVEDFEHLLGTLRVLSRATYHSLVEWDRIMDARHK